jgi:nicotinamidase-related amidase
VARNGLEALLRPEDSFLALVDHQPFQFANMNSHEPTMIMNNVVGLAKAGKLFGVPTLLSTVLKDRGGRLLQGVQDVFPEQSPIDRSLINSWQDERFVEAVRNSGRKQLVLAALWTEICLAMTAVQALGEGYDVFIVTDASGGASVEAHEMRNSSPSPGTAELKFVATYAIPTVTSSNSERRSPPRQWIRPHRGNTAHNCPWKRCESATQFENARERGHPRRVARSLRTGSGG